ncbi:MAG TPA: hypothetical protein VG889_07485 [Rhizomicrobium sp.]|nr:hypothetical protein [Rhizomicrobium sp.]
MRWLTEDATLACEHGGTISIKTSQDFVRIEKKRVLIEPNPEGRSIGGCPNSNPVAGIRSCLTTLKVRQGYSDFVRIAGHAVCLDSIQGLTDGTPPGIVAYKVRAPGQKFVEASA